MWSHAFAIKFWCSFCKINTNRVLYLWRWILVYIFIYLILRWLRAKGSGNILHIPPAYIVCGKVKFTAMSSCLSVCSWVRWGGGPMWWLPMMPLVSHRSQGQEPYHMELFKPVNLGPPPLTGWSPIHLLVSKLFVLNWKAFLSLIIVLMILFAHLGG